MAGGTDLMVQRARGFAIAPEFEKPLLFIEHLSELKKIYIENDEINIGACAILTDIMKSEIIPPVLKKIIGQMASPPTRNMASFAGNICNASPAGDTLPYLYAVDAKITLESSNEKRTILVSEFIKGPKKTVLKANELVTNIIIPHKTYSHNVYRRLGQRKGMSLTKASLLGMADIENGKIIDIRIALGAVSAIIARCKEIEESLKNKSIKDVKDDVTSILAKYDHLIKPIDDARSTALYRKKVSLNMIKQFLENLK